MDFTKVSFIGNKKTKNKSLLFINFCLRLFLMNLRYLYTDLPASQFDLFILEHLFTLKQSEINISHQLQN